MNDKIKEFITHLEQNTTKENDCWLHKKTFKIGKRKFSLERWKTQTCERRPVFKFVREIDVPVNMFVMPKCLNLLCLNPDHLLMVDRQTKNDMRNEIYKKREIEKKELDHRLLLEEQSKGLIRCKNEYCKKAYKSNDNDQGLCSFICFLRHYEDNDYDIKFLNKSNDSCIRHRDWEKIISYGIYEGKIIDCAVNYYRTNIAEITLYEFYPQCKQVFTEDCINPYHLAFYSDRTIFMCKLNNDYNNEYFEELEKGIKKQVSLLVCENKLNQANLLLEDLDNAYASFGYGYLNTTKRYTKNYAYKK